ASLSVSLRAVGMSISSLKRVAFKPYVLSFYGKSAVFSLTFGPVSRTKIVIIFLMRYIGTIPLHATTHSEGNLRGKKSPGAFSV
ncbi:hypothetical protein, partial [uncultured Desulfovibrio sp.]|uniref:hypothetical protein n=1 Tax=uncultured Desulfovibrio sp. TaxID=167968 RepID=UPI00261C1116